MAVVAARAHRRLEHTRAPSGASDASRRQHPVQTAIMSPATQCSGGSRAGFLVIAHGKGIKHRQLFVPIQGVKRPWGPIVPRGCQFFAAKVADYVFGGHARAASIGCRPAALGSKVPFQHSGTFISNRYLRHQTRVVRGVTPTRLGKCASCRFR